MRLLRNYANYHFIFPKIDKRGVRIWSEDGNISKSIRGGDDYSVSKSGQPTQLAQPAQLKQLVQVVVPVVLVVTVVLVVLDVIVVLDVPIVLVARVWLMCQLCWL